MLIMSPIRTKNWIKKKVIFTSGTAHWYRVVRFSCSHSVCLSDSLPLSLSTPSLPLFVHPFLSVFHVSFFLLTIPFTFLHSFSLHCWLSLPPSLFSSFYLYSWRASKNVKTNSILGFSSSFQPLRWLVCYSDLCKDVERNKKCFSCCCLSGFIIKWDIASDWLCAV